MRNIFITVSIFLAFISCLPEQERSVSIQSPNGKYILTLNLDGDLSYSISYLDSVIINPSLLGFEYEAIDALNDSYSIKKIARKSVKSSWKPVYGERSEYIDHYNEVLVELQSKNKQKQIFNLRLRAYDEGVAFRYEFVDVNNAVNIMDEITEFSLPDNSVAWVSARAQSEIFKTSISEIEGEVERPMLIEIPGNGFVAVGEAGLVDFARMKFRLKERSTIKSSLSSSVHFEQPMITPWRYVMAASRPTELLQNNHLLLNLSEPCKIDDNSWIRPGKVIREVTLTTQGGLACVDFAEKHSLQFVEFDAGWYGNEYDSLSDATTISVDPKRSKGPLDLHKVIAYAKSKDIGIILYVNRRALEKQIDDILPLYQSWGIAGVKYGFVNVGPQKWTSWLHEAIRKAADHQLMVDIHDEYRPTGYSRTYPNLMTQEGIRGDEESPDNSMVLNTLFTRMIAGAGDHTNCYLASRVDEKMGSHASQLAKAICMYSPWQFLFWYDRPQGSPVKKGGAGGAVGFIPEIKDLEFYDQLPTVWDESKVIDGYPGEFAVVARRKGDAWFVGVLNGKNKKTINISFNFLQGDQEYTAQIFCDDASQNTKTNVKINSLEVVANTLFSQEVHEMNGLAIILRPVAN